MNTYIYKIKNKLFRFSKEASKIKRPSYEELLVHKHFSRGINNKFVLSFGAGRCGQNWFAKIFNSHPNWIGTSERFADFESFYRFVSFNKLEIDTQNFFYLLELAYKRDLEKYNNTFIASPYFAFGVEELSNKLNPDYLFFNIRNPIESVESFYRKGWYLNFNDLSNKKIPSIDISNNLNRSFSRIIPNDEFYDEWHKLTRIGKITWFWAITYKSIFDDFNKITNIDKFFFKLEDVNQNYNFYEKLSIKFDFEKKMSKSKFYDVINKAPNRGPSDKYKYKDWNNLEKKEFENIITRIFPNYNNINTSF